MYRIYPVDVIEALEYANLKSFDGLLYPNREGGEYLELKMTPEEMTVMRLSVPCIKVEKLDGKVL